jgi:hypothetical protein
MKNKEVVHMQFTFPDNFIHLVNAKPVSDETVNEWIKECIEQLESDKSCPWIAVSSGNTIAEVRRCSDDDYLGYEVIVARDYYKGYITRDGDSLYPLKGAVE